MAVSKFMGLRQNVLLLNFALNDMTKRQWKTI